MKVRFHNKDVQQLETDSGFFGGFSGDLVKVFRSRVHFIRQAQDERDLYAMKSFRFEKLKGGRSHQHSIRLNDQWRVVLEFEGDAPNKVAVIIDIEDYH
jgi:proteic killer suppression protein